MFKKLFAFALVSSLAVISLASTAFAESSSPFAEDNQGPCDYESLGNEKFDSSLIAIRRKLKVEPGEVFKVKVFLKNTGNTPWFSGDSECSGPHMSLGTDRPRDRKSNLYSLETLSIENSGWEQSNRIGMDQERTNPGQIASFTFYAKAGDNADVYKEYFTPVIEGVEWLEKTSISFEIIVGDISDSPSILRQKMSYAAESGSVLSIDLNAEKSLLVDISDQSVFLKLGDRVIKEFRVSTGKSSTPTPYGSTKIILKQEVRVAGAYPHYIMPKFMMFRAGGYGFHALPSLSFDGGRFWTEARSHIGIPVSHGCIRLLPEDADFIYNFTDIGTKVTVQP